MIHLESAGGKIDPLGLEDLHMTFTETLPPIRVTKDLKERIYQAAEQQGLSVSAHMRRLATIWHQPDKMTLEYARLVDAPVEYKAGE